MRDWTESGRRGDYKGVQGNFGRINMFIILIVAMVSCVDTYVKTFQIIYPKCEQSIVRQLNLNKTVKKKNKKLLDLLELRPLL